MYLFGRTGKNGFGYRTTAEQVTKDLDASKITAIITGSTSGIGLETARVLALRGAHVYIAGRSEASTTAAKESLLKEQPSAKLDILAPLDLTSQASIRKAAAKFLALDQPLNLLINNAGIMVVPYGLTEDGIELHLGTNHIGHFLLTNLLLDKLKETANETGVESRIVMVSAVAIKAAPKSGFNWDHLSDGKGYNKIQAYALSKLGNLYYAQELTRQLQAEGVTNVTINALHPGVIKTKLTRHIASWMMSPVYAVTAPIWKSIPQGAATQCYVALSPALNGVSGKWFSDCAEEDVKVVGPLGQNEEMAKKLWDVSVQLTSA